MAGSHSRPLRSPHPETQGYRDGGDCSTREISGRPGIALEATPMPFRCRPIPTKNPRDAADLSTPQEFFVRFEGPNPYGAFYSI
jgi:hypothetical protein